MKVHTGAFVLAVLAASSAFSGTQGKAKTRGYARFDATRQALPDDPATLKSIEVEPLIRSLRVGLKPGVVAPDFDLPLLVTKENAKGEKIGAIAARTVKLSSFRGKKPVAITLSGSTWPPFDRQAGRLAETRKQYADKAEFLFVYVQCHGAAHGIGDYAKQGDVPTCTEVARDINERAMQAYEQQKKMAMTWTTLVDRMDNAANRMYGVPPAVHCIVDIDGRVVVHTDGKKAFPADVLKAVVQNGGRLPGAKPNPVKPMADHPAGWSTVTTSNRNAFHNLLAFYHKQKRWADALQLMGQHRHHLAKENPSLITYAVDVLADASGKGKGSAAWIRLLAEHIRNVGPNDGTSTKVKDPLRGTSP